MPIIQQWCFNLSKGFLRIPGRAACGINRTGSLPTSRGLIVTNIGTPKSGLIVCHRMGAPMAFTTSQKPTSSPPFVCII